MEHSLLPKKEINLYVGMTEMQRKWYRMLLEKDIDAVNGELAPPSTLKAKLTRRCDGQERRKDEATKHRHAAEKVLQSSLS